MGLVLNCEKCRKVISKEEWNDNLRCCYKCRPKKEKRRYRVTYNERKNGKSSSFEFDLETTVSEEKDYFGFTDEVTEVNDYLDEKMWETKMYEKKIERIEGEKTIKIFHFIGDFKVVE